MITKQLIQKYGARKVGRYALLFNTFSFLCGIIFYQIPDIDPTINLLATILIPFALIGMGASALIYYFHATANQVANGTYVEDHMPNDIE